jgi:hypothetical protein
VPAFITTASQDMAVRIWYLSKKYAFPINRTPKNVSSRDDINPNGSKELCNKVAEKPSTTPKIIALIIFIN